MHTTPHQGWPRSRPLRGESGAVEPDWQSTCLGGTDFLAATLRPGRGGLRGEPGAVEPDPAHPDLTAEVAVYDERPVSQLEDERFSRDTELRRTPPAAVT